MKTTNNTQSSTNKTQSTATHNVKESQISTSHCLAALVIITGIGLIVAGGIGYSHLAYSGWAGPTSLILIGIVVLSVGGAGASEQPNSKVNTPADAESKILNLRANAEEELKKEVQDKIRLKKSIDFCVSLETIFSRQETEEKNLRSNIEGKSSLETLQLWKNELKQILIDAIPSFREKEQKDFVNSLQPSQTLGEISKLLNSTLVEQETYETILLTGVDTEAINSQPPPFEDWKNEMQTIAIKQIDFSREQARKKFQIIIEHCSTLTDTVELLQSTFSTQKALENVFSNDWDGKTKSSIPPFEDWKNEMQTIVINKIDFFRKQAKINFKTAIQYHSNLVETTKLLKSTLSKQEIAENNFISKLVDDNKVTIFQPFIEWKKEINHLVLPRISHFRDAIKKAWHTDNNNTQTTRDQLDKNRDAVPIIETQRQSENQLLTNITANLQEEIRTGFNKWKDMFYKPESETDTDTVL